MNTINASSLFHFTKKYSSLKNIMLSGLRYSFAFEEQPGKVIANLEYPEAPIDLSDTHANTGIAIPMISFCDIPITRSLDHIGKYGGYMIGVDKKIISEVYNTTLNPVIYYNSNNFQEAIVDLSIAYSTAHKELVTACLNKVKSDKSIMIEELPKKSIDPLIHRKFNTKFLIGFTKPCYDKKQYCFYDEREWRTIKMDGARDDCSWKIGITKEEFNENRNDWNKELSTSSENYITLPDEYLDAITHIVVKTEEEIPKMVKTIMNAKKIFGFEGASEQSKLILVSRVTSLERIEKDY